MGWNGWCGWKRMEDERGIHSRSEGQCSHQQSVIESKIFRRSWRVESTVETTLHKPVTSRLPSSYVNIRMPRKTNTSTARQLRLCMRIWCAWTQACYTQTEQYCLVLYIYHTITHNNEHIPHPKTSKAALWPTRIIRNRTKTSATSRRSWTSAKLV